MDTRLPDCLTPGAALRAPLDASDLAVRLEADGVTDEVAHGVHGYANTLAMAEDWLPRMVRAAGPGESGAVPASAASVEWLRGTAFAVPMVLCALSMLFLGVSLWGGALEADRASAVAIAMVGSLLVTGGFVQGASRRVLFYLGAKDYATAAALAMAWGKASALALGAAAMTALAANFVFAWMPPLLAVQTAAFFLLLGGLWLACGGLYMAGRTVWIGLSVAMGIGVTASLHRAAGLELFTSQLAGIAVATVAAVGGTVSWFRARLGKRLAAPVNPAREIYYAAPYFAYGAAYYLFLFADRLIAWTAGVNAAALPLQFRGDYETALDLAMAAFILQCGWVHVSLSSFHRSVEATQRDLGAGEFAAFNRTLARFYGWRAARIGAYGLAASGFMFYLVTMFGWLPFPAMNPVLVLALLSFPLVVLALWNTSLLFAIARPGWAAAAAAAGALTSLTIGYLLTRTGSYESAVVGFLAGSFVFAAISAAGVVRSLNELDGRYFNSAL